MDVAFCGMIAPRQTYPQEKHFF